MAKVKFLLDIFDLLGKHEKFGIDFDDRTVRSYPIDDDFPYFNAGKLHTKSVENLPAEERNDVSDRSLDPDLLCAYVKILFKKSGADGLILPYGDEKYDAAKCVPWMYDIDFMNLLYPNRNFIICRRDRTIVYKGGKIEVVPLDTSVLWKLMDKSHYHTQRFLDAYENYWKTLQQRSKIGLDFMKDKFVVYGLYDAHVHYLEYVYLKSDLGECERTKMSEKDYNYRLETLSVGQIMYRYLIHLKMFNDPYDDDQHILYNIRYKTLKGYYSNNILYLLGLSLPVNNCDKSINIKLLKDIYFELQDADKSLTYPSFYGKNFDRNVITIISPLKNTLKGMINELNELLDFVNNS